MEPRILNYRLQERSYNSATTVVLINTNFRFTQVLLYTSFTVATDTNEFIIGMVMGASGRLTPNGMRIGEAANRTRVRSGVSQWAVVRRAAGQLYDAARHPRQVPQRRHGMHCHEVCARQWRP
jgi:hypothetical protein